MSVLKLHLIHLSDQRFLGQLLLALEQSALSLQSLELVIYSRLEWLESMPLLSQLKIHWVGISSEDIMRAQKSLMTGEMELWESITFSSRPDVLVNTSLTQASFYLMKVLQAPIKLGPKVDHLNKVQLGDDLSQQLYLWHDLKEHSGLTAYSILHQLFSVLAQEFKSVVAPMKTLLSDDCVNQMRQKTSCTLGIFFHQPSIIHQLSRGMLYQWLKDLPSTEIHTNEQSLNLVLDLAQVLGLKVHVSNLEQSAQDLDYCFTDEISVSWWTSLLSIPLVVLSNRQPLYHRTWWCPQELGLLFPVLSAPMSERQQNLIHEYWQQAKNLESLSQWCLERCEQLPHQHTEGFIDGQYVDRGLGAIEVLRHCQEVIWAYYFRQEELELPFTLDAIAQDPQQLELSEQIKKRLQLIQKCFQWMMHLSDRVLKHQLAGPEFRTQLNQLFDHQQDLVRQWPSLGAMVTWFRARLMNEKVTDLEHQARRLILGVQETTLCLKACEELFGRCYPSSSNIGVILKAQ